MAHSAETVLRIRSDKGWVMSEWTIRGEEVELVKYDLDGRLADRTTVSLGAFYAAMLESQSAT